MKAKAGSAAALSPLIDHVVIIVKENHTYDNYFGTFPNSEGDDQLGKAQNPPKSDPNHRHETWMKRSTDHRYEVQYSRKDIPTYFALADQYTLCDHFFSEVAGPSTPSHFMLITADSPVINNPPFSNSPTNLYDLKSLPMALQNAGITWGNYGGYAFHYIRELATLPQNHTRDLFAHQAAAGHLPSVSWVYGDGGSPNYSEHATQNITPGSEWTGQQIQAIVAGGLWPRTVVFVTWDDWGGWCDHVVPPNVEQWDSRRAKYPSDALAVSLRLPRSLSDRQSVCEAGACIADAALPHQHRAEVVAENTCRCLIGSPRDRSRSPGRNRDRRRNPVGRNGDCIPVPRTWFRLASKPESYSGTAAIPRVARIKQRRRST